MSTKKRVVPPRHGKTATFNKIIESIAKKQDTAAGKRKVPVKLVTAGAIEQPPKVRGIPGKKMDPHHIEAIGKALRRGAENAITIKGLAKRLRCSLGAAERRFNAYMKKHIGFDQKVKSIPVRDGERGPFSTGFYL